MLSKNALHEEKNTPADINHIHHPPLAAEMIHHLDHPDRLEELFRSNEMEFRTAFETIYPEIKSHPIAQFWNARLNFKLPSTATRFGKQPWVILFLCLFSGCVAKLPDWLGWDENAFFQRNLAFVIFPALMAYWSIQRRTSWTTKFIVAAVCLVCVVFINALSPNDLTDSVLLACIHLPVVLWFLWGMLFSVRDGKVSDINIEFLKHNGELLVLSGLLLLTGGLITAVTLALFELIGVRAETFYFRHIAVWGLASIPLVATYLIGLYPPLVRQISPVIAQLVTPLVLIMLLIYLGAIVYTKHNPYDDRQFLMLFNVLLIGVLAIILFSVAESSAAQLKSRRLILLFALAMLTVLLNGIALSAIVFRIHAWGITPNRLAVLGCNVMVLLQLLWVTVQMSKVLWRGKSVVLIHQSLTQYLKYYAIWALGLTILFPLCFDLWKIW